MRLTPAMIGLILISHPASAQSGPAWHLGIEGGVGQFRSVKLNAASAAATAGRTFDRRGIVRLVVAVGGIAGNTGVFTGAASLELRPLALHRFTPILFAGGGAIHSLEEEYGTEGYGFVGGGVALRASPRITVTFKGAYGDARSGPGPHTAHVGIELRL